MVLPTYLAMKIDLYMDHDDTEITLVRSDRQASLRKIGRLPQVKKLHDDGIVHMPHHVYIIETQL